MTTIAVLFTGSRYASAKHAPHKQVIWDALRKLHNHLQKEDDPTIVLVEGEAAGADTIARMAGEALGWRINPHPAQWEICDGPECTPEHRKEHTKPAAMRGKTFCPTAGTRRNQRMVDAVVKGLADGTYDAAICIATPLGYFSKGTNDCMRRANDARIEVNRFDLQPAPRKGSSTKTRGARHART